MKIRALSATENPSVAPKKTFNGNLWIGSGKQSMLEGLEQINQENPLDNNWRKNRDK